MEHAIEDVRRELKAAGVDSVLTEDLKLRTRAAYGVAREHRQPLGTTFPAGVPSGHDAAFRTMSGLNEVDQTFSHCMSQLRGILPTWQAGEPAEQFLQGAKQDA